MRVLITTLYFLVALLMNVSSANANQCSNILPGIFTDGVASHDSNGKIQFEKKSVIYLYLNGDYYYNDGVIDFIDIDDKTEGNRKSCGYQKCRSSGSVTQQLDLGEFQQSNSSQDLQISTSINVSSGDYKNITVKSHGKVTFNSAGGTYKMDKLELEKNTEAWFAGGVYYIDNFTLKDGAKVHHNGGGTVIIHAKNNVQFEKNVRFNREGSASQFLLYAEKNVDLKDSSESRVYIYSDKKVQMEKNSFLKGGINSIDIHMKQDSTIFYDSAGVSSIDRCGQGDVNPPAEPVLVGHWKNNVCSLDGSNGEVVDVIAGNNGQSVDGASIEVDGKFCQALRFDGADANVLIPHDEDFALADGSVSFWFKASDLSHSSDRGQGGQGLWSKDSSGWNEGGDHLTIWLNSNGSLRVRHQIPDDSSQDINLYSASSSVSANQWYHLVYTWGSEGSFLYLNGNEVDDNSAVRSLAGNPEPIIVGANAWTTENYGSSSGNLKDKFKGEIDDLRLYSGQVDIDEVREIRDEENPDTCGECVVEEPELVAQYGADVCDINGDGGSYVDSINGYNGLYIDGVTTASGKFCNSVVFSGDDEHINIPHVNDFYIAEGAIAMWVNVPDLDFSNVDDSIHDGQAIFSKDSRNTDNGGKHLTLWVNDNGSVRVRHQTSGENEIQTSSGVINEDQWHHIMYTWGSDGKRLYIDGQLEDSDSGFSQGIETNPEPIILGANASTTGNGVSAPADLDNWFKGQIDDLRIYGNAQPDDDFVQTVANDVVNCQECSTPIAHYKFEGSFEVAFDSETGQFNGNEFPEGESGISILSCAAGSSLGSGQVMSIPKNDSGSIRTAMDSGIDPDDIGPKGTISFWYQANESWVNGRARQLFDGSDSSKYFHGTIISDGRVMFGMEDRNDGDARVFTSNSFNFSAGTWVHLAFAWDITNDTDMRIYINGVQQSVTKPIDTINTSQTNFASTIFFGDNSHPSYLVGGSTGNSADGQYDDIRVYNIVLQSSDVSTDMSDITPCVFGVTRYRLEFPATVASCDATDIVVKACEDQNCNNLATGVHQVWVDYEDANGDTTSVVDAFNLSNGIGTISNFVPDTSGTGTFIITAADPNPSLTTTCNQPDCQITYTDADIEVVYIVDGQTSGDTPVEIGDDFLSNNPDTSLSVRTPGACQLSESLPLEMAIECLDPAICSGESFYSFNSIGTLGRLFPVNKLANNAQMPEDSFHVFNIAFNGSELSLEDFIFTDVGEIRMHLRVGDQIVTKDIIFVPQYLELSSDIHPVSADLETVNTAGDNFNMTVTAIGGQGRVLPNYKPGDLEFSLQRITPEDVNGGSTSLYITNSADSNEVLAVADSSSITQFDSNGFNTQPTFTGGVSNALVTYMPEVGRYAVDVQDSNYLGKGADIGVIQSKLVFEDIRDTSGNLDLNEFVFARFIPAEFDLAATLDYYPYCGVFSYRGDPIEADADGTPHILQFTAKNARGDTTAYYDAGINSSRKISAVDHFVAGKHYTTEYLGQRLPGLPAENGLLLYSMGTIYDSNQTAFSVWRIMNATDNSHSVRLSDINEMWEVNLQVSAYTNTFVASPIPTSYHRLSLGSQNLRIENAISGVHTLPTTFPPGVLPHNEVGGSFKFDLSSNMFAGRFYNAVEFEEGQNGAIIANNYSHASYSQENALFINNTLADGVFEYHFEADNITFNKYFGIDNNGNELAQTPVINGTDVGDVSVRFNVATDILKDSDNVSVALNSIVETTGKTVSIASVNGSQTVIIDNLLDAFEIRSGRIRLVNSVSAELATEVGIVSEYYAGDNNWETNALDSCNSYDSSELAFMYVQNSISGTPTVENSGQFDSGIGDGADAMTLTIDGFVDEDNSTGVVDLGYKIPTELHFLQYQWCTTTNHVNTRDSNRNSTSTEIVLCLNPTAQFTFGLERGNDRIIHWREVLK